jgi:hypothetical protein
MTEKYVVTGLNKTLIEENFVVRIFPKGRESILNFEPEVIKKAFGQGVKIPELLGDSREHNVNNISYIIYKYLPGRPLSEVYEKMGRVEKNSLIKEIVNNLFMLSRVSCNKFGPLDIGLNGKYESWKSFLFDSLANGKPYLKKHSELNSSLISNLNSSFPNDQNQACVKSDLVWLDFHPENIIVNDSNKLEGFIDFEEMVSGDLKMALGYLFAREGSSNFFQEVYREYSNTDNSIILKEVEQYAFIRLCRIAPYLKFDLPSGKKRDSLFVVFKGIKELNLKVETEFGNYKSFVKKIFFINENTESNSTNQQKIRAAVSLFWFSIFISVLFLFLFIVKLDKNQIYEQTWENSENILLEYSKAPIWFKYEGNTLYSDIAITDEMKVKLYNLASDTISKNTSYFKEINTLTFNSRQGAPKSIYIILACGLLAIFGVNIRSMWDFVGNASYKNELNMSRWWPWYFLRPLIGFMAGIGFYFLFNGGVLEINGISVSKSKLYLLLGLSTLIGFGLNDFIERLRLISKAMFGSNEKKNS